MQNVEFETLLDPFLKWKKNHGPSITHEDAHFAKKKKALKLDENLKSAIFFNFPLLTHFMSKTTIVI
jgi:hypothetical protein